LDILDIEEYIKHKMKKKLLLIILLGNMLLLSSCPPFWVTSGYKYKIRLPSGKDSKEKIGLVNGIKYKIHASVGWVNLMFGEEETPEDYPWGPYFNAKTEVSIEIKNESQECVVFDVKKVRLISKYYHYKFHKCESIVYAKGDNRGRVERDKNLKQILPKEKQVIWIYFISQEVVTPKKRRPHIPLDEELILYIDGLKKGGKKLIIPEIHLVP
jgi:hypothetical protein